MIFFEIGTHVLMIFSKPRLSNSKMTRIEREDILAY